MDKFNKSDKFERKSGGKFRGRTAKPFERNPKPFDRSSKPFERREGPRSGRGFSQETFEAVCAKCGQKCDLPFKPRGDKPVYCRDCFRGNDDARPRFEDRHEPVHHVDQSDELKQINEKLDKIMRALDVE